MNSTAPTFAPTNTVCAVEFTTCTIAEQVVLEVSGRRQPRRASGADRIRTVRVVGYIRLSPGDSARRAVALRRHLFSIAERHGKWLSLVGLVAISSSAAGLALFTFRGEG
ncbi:MAG: hypothetical protein ACRDQU_22410 [Pseudonocardiaceae bacterium]